jgi:phosphoglycerate-specific signal transduction histidine kinase
MTKPEKINELIREIGQLQKDKIENVKEQQYEKAASIRDDEHKKMLELDELVGVKDLFRKIHDTKELVQHIEDVVNSMIQIRRFESKYKKELSYIDFSRTLIDLTNKKNDALLSVLDIQEKIKKE